MRNTVGYRNLKSKGTNVYFIPVGGSNAIGALGYVECLNEIIKENNKSWSFLKQSEKQSNQFWTFFTSLGKFTKFTEVVLSSIYPMCG